MTDQTDVNTPESDTPNTTPSDSRMVPLKEHVDLRKERNKYKELYEAQAAEKAALEQAEALKRGEFEKVLAEWKPQIEDYKRLQATVSEMLTAEMESLSTELAEQAQHILSEIPSEAGRLKAIRGLKAFAPTQAPKPTPPPLNGGDGTRSNGNGLMPSATDLEFAQAAGIPIEKYMQHKTKE